MHNAISQCFIRSFTGAPTWCNARNCFPLARNGIFNCQFLAKLDKSKSLLNLSGMEVDYFFIFCLLKILITCCDIKLNLGPKKDKSCDNFSLYQWKLYLPLHIRHYMKRSPHVRHYMSLRYILRLFRSLWWSQIIS